MKQTLLRRIGVAVVAVGLSAGCSSTPDAAEVPASVPPVSREASVSESPVVSSETSPSSSVVESSVEEVVASDTVVVSSAPAPTPWDGLELTDAQIADAQAALAAYRGYTSAADLAFTDPTQDWSAAIYAFATDPEASGLLEFLSRPAVQIGRGSGSTLISPKVTKVEPALVTLSDCVDSTQAEFVDIHGNSLVAPDEPGTFKRHPSEITVGQYSDGQWLVTVVIDNYDTQC